jgi:hypothetical protein
MSSRLRSRVASAFVSGLVAIGLGFVVPTTAAANPTIATESATASVSNAKTAFINCYVRHVPFRPTYMDIYGTGGGIPVISRARNRRSGIPGTPPISSWGKNVMAWSPNDAKPGAYWGNVLLNAHTWPDGSALGNRMLSNLRVGDLIIMYGGGRHLCYRVTKRVVYNPRGKKMMKQYYNWRSRSKLAIVVCSGKRLGPGNWTKRTVWYAQPSIG